MHIFTDIWFYVFLVSMIWLFFGISVMTNQMPPKTIKQWVVALFVTGPVGSCIIIMFVLLYYMVMLHDATSGRVFSTVISKIRNYYNNN